MANRGLNAQGAKASRRGRNPWRALGVAAACGILGSHAARAFPLLQDLGPVPQGVDLAAPDATDLQHQLQLSTGLTPPLGGGWTFVPRLDLQEMMTDNVYQASSPRRWDLVTYIGPGFDLQGNLPRTQVSLSYQPTLSVYAHTGPLNAMSQQLNGLATVTLKPDRAYVDLRAVSGVQNIFGGLAGLGTLGAASNGVATTNIPTLGGNTQGLNRSNEVQTSSFSFSPYVVGRVGDWARWRVGYSLNVAHSDQISGFASLPIPTGGSNAQTMILHEENATITSGSRFPRVQNALDLDFQQQTTTADAGSINNLTGQPLTVTTRNSDTRATISNRIGYALNPEILVFASGGYENIQYSQNTAQSISDPIWSVGTTLTPGPDLTLTVSYGHLNGVNSFTANGVYALTARTTLTLSYDSQLGTQLEYLRNQLNLAAANNGVLVNGLTGGTLFGASNVVPVQAGIFRTDTLTIGSQTGLDRDVLSLNLLFVKQSTVGAGSASSTSSETASGSWTHQMDPTMTVSGALSYQLQDASVQSRLNGGTGHAWVASLAWQQQLTPTLSESVRYLFFDRQSSLAVDSMTTNELILGISKTF